MNKGKHFTPIESDSLQPEADIHEVIDGGLCYMDSAGVNLQVGFLGCDTHHVVMQYYNFLGTMSSCLSALFLVYIHCIFSDYL